MQNYIQFMIHTKHFLKGGFNAVSYVRCLCGFAETKKQNILTDPCDWIVKQRLVKQISSYKDVDFFFSTSISVMNFKGTFKSTIHPAYQARVSQSIFGSGLEEGAPLKRKLWGGRAGSICGDTYGFLAWLNTPDKSLRPKAISHSKRLPPPFFSPRPHLAEYQANRTLIRPSSPSLTPPRFNFPSSRNKNAHRRDSHTVPSITQKRSEI